MFKLLVVLLVLGSSSPVFASRWFLIATENDPLYKAIGAFRLETTLVRTEGTMSFFWVRTDYLRPPQFKYPKKPRIGALIDPTSVLWRKERFAVECTSQEIKIDQGTYVLAGDDIEWDEKSSRTVVASPNTLFALVYRLACNKSAPRSREAIEQISSNLESKLVRRQEQREKLRDERNRPDFSRT